MRRVGRPSRASEAARLMAVVVLPTPALLVDDGEDSSGRHDGKNRLWLGNRVNSDHRELVPWIPCPWNSGLVAGYR